MNADRQTLARRWAALCQSAGLAGDIDESSRWLIDAYSASDRAYHNLDHLSHCLSELDATHDHAADRVAAELAIWFHDSILDASRADNEERSAEWSASVLGFLGATPERIEAVKSLVMATRHMQEPETPDARLVADIDLTILGQPPEKYEVYRAGIRQEFRHVPDDGFRVARLNFISRLLGLPRIYSTLTFRARYETAARENLQREMQLLGA